MSHVSQKKYLFLSTMSESIKYIIAFLLPLLIDWEWYKHSVVVEAREVSVLSF